MRINIFVTIHRTSLVELKRSLDETNSLIPEAKESTVRHKAHYQQVVISKIRKCPPSPSWPLESYLKLTRELPQSSPGNKQHPLPSSSRKISAQNGLLIKPFPKLPPPPHLTHSNSRNLPHPKQSPPPPPTQHNTPDSQFHIQSDQTISIIAGSTLYQ